MVKWLIRLLKGLIVGAGAILPGLSGGVLAVVLGIYEPLMNFLRNMKVNFWRNALFFLPVGIGAALGVVGVSGVVDFAFKNYAAQFTWLFIGFITGAFPSLFKTASRKGRKTSHWFLLLLVSIGTVLLMRWLATIENVTLEPSIPNWILSGALVGLGAVVPGLSPSNFLIYLGLYQPMAHAIRIMDIAVILPLALGLTLCVFLFARIVAWLFEKTYTSMYHLILGVVIGSTIAIIPGGVHGVSILVCAVLFLLGALCAYQLARLDEKYPHPPLI